LRLIAALRSTTNLNSSLFRHHSRVAATSFRSMHSSNERRIRPSVLDKELAVRPMFSANFATDIPGS
jgi:hypothetical protein